MYAYVYVYRFPCCADGDSTWITLLPLQHSIETHNPTNISTFALMPLLSFNFNLPFVHLELGV